MSSLSSSWSGLRPQLGRLEEYGQGPGLLKLAFEFNPASITRTRNVTIKAAAPGVRGGYDFTGPKDAQMAAQGVTINAESLQLRILLDATDRMNAGDAQAAAQGVQPELDTLSIMLEPKTQSSPGAQTLAALGQGSDRAFARHAYPSVLKFVWGSWELPVFLTQVSAELKAFLPNLCPYRAEVTLQLQLIASRNPVYEAELKRQLAAAQAFSGAAAGGSDRDGQTGGASALV